MKLWYRQPAKSWSEALPIGNGRLGGMVFGDPVREHIQLNEDSIWNGGPMERNNPSTQEYLPRIRRLIREGNPGEAQRLALLAMSGTPNSQRCYQSAGDLHITFHGLQNVTDYTRELDLHGGVVRTRFVSGGVVYHREALASAPDKCMVLRIWNEQNVPFSFQCQLNRFNNFFDGVSARDNTLLLTRRAASGDISFATAVQVQAQGGRMYAIGEFLMAENVTEALLVLDIETSFRHEDYAEAAKSACARCAAKPWKDILRDHTADYQHLFTRLSLRFGRTDAARDAIPTDVRLKEAAAGVQDMGLMEIYFQYGRYLLMSSSRPGSLPANLQGIWNDSLTPPWGSKFTININTEMNYWMAESANLSECHLPLFDHMQRMKVRGMETARRMYGCRGAVAHHNTDIHADTAPQDHYVLATYWVMGLAWLATHVWEHYLYTNDGDFLREHFDILEQCVLFFYDFLIESEDGCLITSPSLSPENTYQLPDGRRGTLTEGCTMDVEILTELFRGYIGACGVLGLEERIPQAQAMMNRFPPLKTGKHGQLMEWMEDYDEPEPGHRHISHLYGVYPGSTITEDTPELRRAALLSLERRLANGGGHTGWSRAWIICLWAAFGDGAKAYENLQAILNMGTFPNLMDTHPMGGGHVFQIDGNFGAAAGMLEMLVQCHSGKCTLLPAITRETDSGEVHGLRIRGGAELSMAWQDGRVLWVEITPDRIAGEELPFTLKMNGTERCLTLHAGKALRIEG